MNTTQGNIYSSHTIDDFLKIRITRIRSIELDNDYTFFAYIPTTHFNKHRPTHVFSLYKQFSLHEHSISNELHHDDTRLIAINNDWVNNHGDKMASGILQF